MQTADKMWIAAGVVGIFLVRDHRQKKQIAKLMKLINAMEMENKLLNMILEGAIDGKIRVK